MKREADISGSQRKVLSAWVAPERPRHGDSGIPIKDGLTLPFRVSRTWSAPAGHYGEQWFLVEPTSREVHHEGPLRDVSVWGLQSATELDDLVDAGIPLVPGTYTIVFALGGLIGGQLDVEAASISAGNPA